MLEYVVTPTGIIQRTVEERAIDPRGVIAALAGAAPPMAFTGLVGPKSVLLVKPGATARTTLKMSEVQWSMAVPIPSLTFQCAFGLTTETEGVGADPTDPILYPVFGNTGPQMSLSWEPPPGLALMFQVDNTKVCRLWVVDIRDPEDASRPRTFRLPAGNLFPDGRICMGDGWASSTSAPAITSPISLVKQALDLFGSSPWNNDLMTADGNDPNNSRWDRSRNLFRWKIWTDGTPLQTHPRMRMGAGPTDADPEDAAISNLYPVSSRPILSHTEALLQLIQGKTVEVDHAF
jgi:hypothetical protein